MTDSVDAERLAGAWSIALGLREQIAATAVSIADTEDSVADTYDYLARVRPRDAERLLALAAHARRFAARERAQAAAYRSRASQGPCLRPRRLALLAVTSHHGCRASRSGVPGCRWPAVSAQADPVPGHDPHPARRRYGAGD